MARALPTMRTSMLALAVAVSLASAARADTITVTGGSVQVEPFIYSARLTFIGDGFLVHTGTEDFFTNVGRLSPFEAGTAIDLSGTWRPTDIRGGDATYNGVHYDQLYFGLSGLNGGTFTTETFVVTGEGLQVVSVPFTFAGTVSAFDHPNFSSGDEPIFTATLAGSGLARAAFGYFAAEDGYPAIYNLTALPGTDYRIEYRFSTAAPVPEPGTLALLATGGLGLTAGLMRRRSSRRRSPRHPADTGR